MRYRSLESLISDIESFKFNYGAGSVLALNCALYTSVIIRVLKLSLKNDKDNDKTETGIENFVKIRNIFLDIADEDSKVVKELLNKEVEKEEGLKNACQTQKNLLNTIYQLFKLLDEHKFTVSAYLFSDCKTALRGIFYAKDSAISLLDENLKYLKDYDFDMEILSRNIEELFQSLELKYKGII